MDIIKDKYYDAVEFYDWALSISGNLCKEHLLFIYILEKKLKSVMNTTCNL